MVRALSRTSKPSSQSTACYRIPQHLHRRYPLLFHHKEFQRFTIHYIGESAPVGSLPEGLWWWQYGIKRAWDLRNHDTTYRQLLSPWCITTTLQPQQPPCDVEYTIILCGKSFGIGTMDGLCKFQENRAKGGGIMAKK